MDCEGCVYPDNCPCFQDPDKPPPSQEELDKIVVDYINLTTTLSELGLDDGR